MAAWRYEISLLVLKKYFTRSLRSLVKYFSALEEKFRISARPYNILFMCNCFFRNRCLIEKCNWPEWDSLKRRLGDASYKAI